MLPMIHYAPGCGVAGGGVVTGGVTDGGMADGGVTGGTVTGLSDGGVIGTARPCGCHFSIVSGMSSVRLTTRPHFVQVRFAI